MKVITYRKLIFDMQFPFLPVGLKWKVVKNVHCPPLLIDTGLMSIFFMEGVNDRLLDHCQISSVPHYCGFKEQDISRIYTVWDLMKRKPKYSNILRY